MFAKYEFTKSMIGIVTDNIFSLGVLPQSPLLSIKPSLVSYYEIN